MRKAGALAAVSIILTLQLALMLNSSRVVGFIPEPYELYGVARDEIGIVLADGSPIRTFIDGVDYSNKSSVFSRAGYNDGFFETETYGNYITNRTVPGTPWIKEGGDDGDDIMYAWGDMSNNTQIGGPTKHWETGMIFKENHTWQTGLPPEPGDLNAAPESLQPPLVKIYIIVTNSSISPFVDYIWLYNAAPYPVDASKLYIQKDVPGSYDGPIVLVPPGTIEPYKRYFVSTGMPNYFVETGDAVKLVWENNASNPQAPFNGKDIIIDRVEFNATIGGTLDWEPGNTIQNNEPAPGAGMQINRSTDCWDTNSVQQDFFEYPEGSEIPPPDAPDPVCIQGLCSSSPGNPALFHLTTDTNLLINWTYYDRNFFPQVYARIYVRNSASQIWIGTTGAEQQTIYNGPPLPCGEDHWVGVSTRNSGPYLSDVTELRFRVNCLPAPVNRDWPLHDWFTTAKGNQQVWWLFSTDNDPGDTLNYSWFVSNSSPIAPPYVSTGTTMNNYSDPFQTLPSSTYHWCVEVSDGWGAPISNCATPWRFSTGSMPPPYATELKIDYRGLGDQYLQRVTNRTPSLSWKFNPTSRSQTRFHVQVLRDSDGFVMWDFNNTGTGGSLNQTAYSSDGTAIPLGDGICYRFSVKVRDDTAFLFWSDWASPLGFCINTPPPVPTPRAPADDSVLPPGSTVIYWNTVTDADPGDIISYEYCVDLMDPPYPSCGAAGDRSTTDYSGGFTTVEDGNYSWAVRAFDQHEYSNWSAVWNFTAKTTIVPPPVAKATGISEAFVGELVTFYGNASLGNISRYIWTIRDSQGALVVQLTGMIVSYAFQNPGTYSITLTVYDDSTGLTGSDVLYILIKSLPKEGFDWTLLLILLAIMFIIAPIGGTEVGRVVLLTLMVAPLHGRRTKEKDEAETRGMIRGFIVGNPGECYTSIKQNLGLKNGTLSWHLMKLEKEGIVKSRVQGTRRRYYPKGVAIPAENGGELREIEKRLLGAVEKDVGRSVKELAEELGVSSQLALYHIRRLSQKGRVALERKGLRLRVYLPPDNKNS